MSFKSIPANTKQALDIINNQFVDVLNEFEFYLAGGTSLSLQINHRISYDLDFFTKRHFDSGHLLNLFHNLKIENIQTSFGL